MAELDQKYVVFKSGPITTFDMETPLEEGSYFVLRSQDMLAVQALWAYVGTLRTAVDVLGETGVQEAMELGQGLSELSDSIAEMASRWEDDKSNKKLPD